MANPLKFINPDVTTLEFHVDNITDKRETIYYSVVGKSSEATKEAVNEKQIMSSFESQTAVLLRIAKNFQLIQQFAEKCKIDERYGTGALSEISIDFGTKFFLKSYSDLVVDLDMAKKNGSHASIISALMDETIEAKYRNDKSGLTRAQIIQELDPLPDKTQEEAEKILGNGGITKKQYIIKCNIIPFAKRFEREQTSLTEFASKRPFAVKIALIQEEFNKYAEEISDGQEPEPSKKIVKPEANETEPEEVLINNE
jgi:hypothetical protein